MSTPTFEEWLEKYFMPPVTLEMYRAKHNNKLHTEAELKKRWKKAYKNIND